MVTGASKGIGKAIVNELELSGFNCICPSSQELDVSSIDSIKNYMRMSNFTFHGLINNAGINIIGDIDSIDNVTTEKMINTNLVGPLFLIQEVSKNMKLNSFGKIVNISSIWGVRSKEMRTLYSATKFAINGITKSLARELGEYNILVNSVAPGYVNTEMTKKNVPKEVQEDILNHIPLKRFAEPSEIAKIVKFLISNENTYITGQTIIADGGYLA